MITSFKKMKSRFVRQWYKRLPFRTEHLAIQDIQAIQKLSSLLSIYLPWTGFSLRPSAVEKILNEILFSQSETIVECGGGISTLYIAALLRQSGKGHLYTIEHNAEWLDLLCDLLQSQGLDSYVTVIHAPLTACPLAINGIDWYDLNPIKESLASCKVDLLLVDGPTALGVGNQLVRYPAVPFFKDFFSENYIVILDDFHRTGEQTILRKWSSLLNLRFEPHRSDGSIAIGRRNYTFANTSRVV